MPARIDPDTPTLRDAEVVQYHEVENLSLDETARKMNLSRSTIKRIKKRPAYNDLAIMALEEKQRFVDVWMEKLWEGANSQKVIVNKDGEREQVADHTTRFKYIDRVCNIYGVDAPKEIDVRHSVAGTSDEELAEEIKEAESRLGMDERPGQPPEITGGSGEKQGTVL